MVNDGPLVGSMWQGEYLLQAALGDPTHGVFRAQRRRDSQTVALRLWRAPTDALASQFLEHASAACSIRHPSLAQVEACGREEHFCFLVSEYVVGQKLDTWADQVGIPPLAAACCTAPSIRATSSCCRPNPRPIAASNPSCWISASPASRARAHR